MDLKNKITETSKLALVLNNSKCKTIQKTTYSPSSVELPNQDINNAFKHYIPSNKEWSSTIYSFNKNNLVLAPQISQWTYELSKSYLNASPKSNIMDNIYIAKNRSKKNFSKIFFKGCVSGKNSLNKGAEVNTTDIRMNKHLSTFRKSFKMNSNLRRNIMKFFNVSSTKSNGEKVESTNLSIHNMLDTDNQRKWKRYSVLKTFLSKPEIRYSSRNVNITLYIYNRKNMFILKNIKKNFDLMKAKFNANVKNNFISTLSISSKGMKGNKGTQAAIKEWKKKNRVLRKLFNKNRVILRNKFFYKLSKKSSITFFLYMWRYLKASSLNSLCKNINLFNQFIAKGFDKNLFKFIFNRYAGADTKGINKWNNLNKLNYITEEKKKDLKKIMKKYSRIFKISEEFLVSNFNALTLKSNLVRVLRNNMNQEHSDKLVMWLNKSKEVYGFKPFANLYYFKHNILAYYFEYYKRNNNNLLALKNVFFKIFFKRIYFNIVNLKYWNLDSKIMADIITTKLVDRTKNVLKVLKRSISSRPTFNLVPTILKLKENNNSTMFAFDRTKNDFFFSRSINRLKSRNIGYKLVLNERKQNNKISNHHILFVSNKYKNNLLLDNLQNKWKIGTKLQAKGRITKRKTAQRSLSKIKYVGTLKNILSSYGGISTSLSRGIVKSNLHNFNNNNHSANGSFGIKVSISSLQTLQRWNMNTN
jgi:hypothetical protein